MKIKKSREIEGEREIEHRIKTIRKMLRFVVKVCKVMFSHLSHPVSQVYWFKDGKQISKRSEHYRISRDADGTCSLHTAAASLDDDGNYTIMAGNPEVSRSLENEKI